MGDSAKDDVVSGTRAGAVTVLLDDGTVGYDHVHAALEGEQRPTHIVKSLIELRALLEEAYELLPPPRPHAAIEPFGGS